MAVAAGEMVKNGQNHRGSSAPRTAYRVHKSSFELEVADIPLSAEWAIHRCHALCGRRSAGMRNGYGRVWRRRKKKKRKKKEEEEEKGQKKWLIRLKERERRNKSFEKRNFGSHPL